MAWKMDLILWLADKLGVDLKEYFRDEIIPDEREEFTRMIEEEFTLTTTDGISWFVYGWLKHNGFDEETVLSFLEDLSDRFDIDLEDEYDGDPVENIYELEDKEDRLYLWKLPDDWTDKQRDNLFARLVSSYRQRYNRDPDAAHFLLTELEEAKELDREEMKELLGHAANDL